MVNTLAHNQIFLTVSANRRLQIHQQKAFEAKFRPISHVWSVFTIHTQTAVHARVYLLWSKLYLNQ